MIHTEGPAKPPGPIGDWGVGSHFSLTKRGSHIHKISTIWHSHNPFTWGCVVMNSVDSLNYTWNSLPSHVASSGQDMVMSSPFYASPLLTIQSVRQGLIALWSSGIPHPHYLRLIKMFFTHFTLTYSTLLIAFRCCQHTSLPSPIWATLSEIWIQFWELVQLIERWTFFIKSNFSLYGIGQAIFQPQFTICKTGILFWTFISSLSITTTPSKAAYNT